MQAALALPMDESSTIQCLSATQKTVELSACNKKYGCRTPKTPSKARLPPKQAPAGEYIRRQSRLRPSAGPLQLCSISAGCVK
ncbi:hypothetical protein EVAR_103885_1 [Eumeta japonica]|uniref:Uncharacterized protein n=1 Tax=Eumeta variegata TaxID=151549 RepID=A0A4C1ZL82_EUMVA|nr:hypothetical protein EVAR_103885_1 [Eumeta japonica]